jgi:hypothetical protein
MEQFSVDQLMAILDPYTANTCQRMRGSLKSSLLKFYLRSCNANGCFSAVCDLDLYVQCGVFGFLILGVSVTTKLFCIDVS